MTPCVNAASSVCNSFVVNPEVPCKLCSFTETCPDLSKPENKRRWIDLELAKRRLLIQLRELGLPPFHVNSHDVLPLKFRFLEDRAEEDGTVTHFYTGHEAGVITINVVEADSVEREQTRVNLREPIRTLIGHMRHEAGHYFDFALASTRFGNDCVQIFGDPASVDYDTAKNRYYDVGPEADWKATFVSPYASMHPWEDFAETSRCYLELMALLTTAVDQGTVQSNDLNSIEAIVNLGLETAVKASEFSRDLGLPALLHQQFNAAVIRKLEFIHNLRQPINEAVVAS